MILNVLKAPSVEMYRKSKSSYNFIITFVILWCNLKRSKKTILKTITDGFNRTKVNIRLNVIIHKPVTLNLYMKHRGDRPRGNSLGVLLGGFQEDCRNNIYL